MPESLSEIHISNIKFVLSSFDFCFPDPEIGIIVKDWRQTEKEISIDLEAGEGVRDNDVELTVTAKICKLRLRGKK